MKILRNKGNSLIKLPSEYTVIDIETTGLDPSFDEIIELSAVKFSNNNKVASFSTLVQPRYKIMDFITELTGITNEMVADAPIIKNVIEDYINFIGDDLIIGHNVNFDINFLYDVYKKYINKELENDYIDTLRLARFILPDLKHHRLIDLIEYYSIEQENFHRAMEDTISTNAIYNNLKNEIISKYPIYEDYEYAFFNRLKPLSVSDYKYDENKDYDITHVFYKKHIVITGTFEKGNRKEAFETLSNLGAILQTGVTKKTDYLITGNKEYKDRLNGIKSTKLKTAEEMKLRGTDIMIISENTYYDLI